MPIALYFPVIFHQLSRAAARLAPGTTMPIYEYRCTSCGHELEALQKITDAPLTQCPACSAAALQKKVSAAGFQLKGSGWYVTDFRNRGAKPAAKSDAQGPGEGNGGASDAKSGESGKSDTTTKTTSTKSGGTTETKATTPASADKSAS
jgi:putative FmdB family regulatory protein